MYGVSGMEPSFPEHFLRSPKMKSTPISQDGILHLARLCSSAYQAPGSFKTDWGTRFQTVKYLDEGGAQVYICQSPIALIIVFRGSDAAGDWIDSLAAAPTSPRPLSLMRVHNGFQAHLSSVKTKLVNTIIRYNRSGNPIYICGHSLGGAAATILAEYVDAFDCMVNLVTFGSPRVGNWAFARRFRKFRGDSLRVVTQGDLIPHTPPAPLFLHHYGPKRVLKDRPWWKLWGAKESHDMSTYLRLLGD